MSQTRVLVIDDSPMVFKAIKRALEPEGFELIGQAFNGQEGLQMIYDQKPDIIVLDITMPVMDGLETAENIFRKNPAAKIIMLSAMGDEELVKKAKWFGVKAFLTKPFKPEELIGEVKSISKV